MSDLLSWTEIAVTVPLSKAGRASEAGAERYLAALCDAARVVSPAGVVIEGADAPATPEQGPPPEGSVRVKVYALDQHVESAMATLGAAVATYPGAEVVTRPLDPDWRERWKRWFKGFEVSPRLAVRPPWEPQPAAAAEGAQREIIIEPGLAFGTGQHATTRLCLEWVDQVFGVDGCHDRMLDVGCGTGVLSIGAALLGAPDVLGVDNDPTAVAVAQENLEANAVTDRVRVETTPLADVEGGWPIVVANILAPILLALRQDLVRVLAPGGRLLLSGLIAAQEAELREAFEAEGARVVKVWTAGDCAWSAEDGTGTDWTAIELTR